jgi:hypothetical protein
VPADIDLGYESNQNVHGVTMPCCLHSGTFSFGFNLSLHDVVRPSSPQILTLGYRFILILRGVTLTLLRMTFVDCSDQSLLSVPLPSSLQTLTFGYKLELGGVALPSSPQAWTFGHGPNPSLLVSRCRGIDLGQGSFQSSEDVALTNGPQALTFGYESGQVCTGSWCRADCSHGPSAPDSTVLACRHDPE